MALNMPPALVARARELANGGAWQVPQDRPAATVVLLRDGAEDLEVLLMRRPDSMKFAPGMHVFPGGRVEPDTDAVPTVTGSLPGGDWGSPALAHALAVAAVRETFEEAGILIAVDHHGRTPAQDAEWEADRAAADLAGRFPDILARRHLHVDADLLVPIAHWITPEIESRRFDTRFVAAALPEGQEVLGHPTETDTAHWLSPAAALAGARSGDRPMLPPTVAVLQVLATSRTVAEALDRARVTPVSPVMPRARIVRGDLVWELVHGYSGAVVSATGEPAGSEELGNRA